MEPFGGFYRGRTVLVTGHTGFKGSWLAAWLRHLGAAVVGYALEPPTRPSHFVACELEKRVTHVHGDVLDYPRLQASFEEHRPEVVFHLAAQSLVRLSFESPRRTFEVNLMGTVNALDAARRSASVRAFVAVTSDKCYRNVGWEWGYRETDALGGNDAYASSKACAELAVEAYRHPGLRARPGGEGELPLASARAGNVLGGGDWARDRVVPDAVRALVAGADLVLRNPDAVRPWQHVLDCLSGYLWLGARLAGEPDRYAGPWNFGPLPGRDRTVGELAGEVLARWPAPGTRVRAEPDASVAEAGVLRLDSSRANQRLGWRPVWDVDPALEATVDWYRRFYGPGDADMHACSLEQIAAYTACARARGAGWAGRP